MEKRFSNKTVDVFTTEQGQKMNAEKPLDRRIQRTRHLLQEALYHLIITRGYEHITIQDITEQANLGRTTFYLHYRDKEDVLRAGITALLDAMHLEVEPNQDETCTFQTVSIRIFHHVQRRHALYHALLHEAGPSTHVGEVMKTYFTELCQRFLPEASADMERPAAMNNAIFAAHAAGSLFGLISWWMEHDGAPPAEQMGTIYYQLMANTMQ